MDHQSNTGKQVPANGWLNGFIGVLVFSGSLPATRAAVLAFDPIFVTVARAAIAGLLALIALVIFKEKRPSKSQMFPLIIVALGVVAGFPLLSALALQYVTSAHSIVFVGLLPLSTAVFGVLRGAERPKPAFWIFSVTGSLLVIGYAASTGLTVSPVGDLLMLGAIILCGLGYAEGARLSKNSGRLAGHLLGFIVVVAVYVTPYFLLLPPRWQQLVYPPGQAWLMFRCSACLSGSYSGTAAWHRVALRR